MTDKQKRFCDEYLVDCNATQAAIRAGYSEKTACEQAARLLANVNIKAYIEKKMEQIGDKNIADTIEVLEYLTSVLRGESKSSIVVVEGTGDGYSEAKVMKKAPDEKERLKAAELIGKRYGLFKEGIDLAGAVPVVISGGNKLED